MKFPHLCLAVVVLSGAEVRAQEGAAKPELPPTAEAQGPQVLASVVRGLYVSTRVGGGPAETGLDLTASQYRSGYANAAVNGFRAISVDAYRGLRRVGHGGGMPGFLCDLALFEDPSGRLQRDIGFVALWNWLDPTLFECAARIVDLVLDAEGGAASSATTTSTAPAPATSSTPPDQPIAGLYACFETGELIHVLECHGQTIGFYLGEATPLVREDDGSLHGAKRGLGFSLRRASRETTSGALEA